ncbi:unnamed protein product, partial [marine sediment metagenome]
GKVYSRLGKISYSRSTNTKLRITRAKVFLLWANHTGTKLDKSYTA